MYSVIRLVLKWRRITFTVTVGGAILYVIQTHFCFREFIYNLLFPSIRKGFRNVNSVSMRQAKSITLFTVIDLKGNMSLI
jgi:hypothetical protein